MKKLLVLVLLILGLISINSLETEREDERWWCIREGRICRRWWHKKCCHPLRCIHGRCRKPWWDENENDNDSGNNSN
jgi:hypothetical protein